MEPLHNRAMSRVSLSNVHTAGRTSRLRTLRGPIIVVAVLAAVVDAFSAGPLPRSQDPPGQPKRVWSGVYTAAQAARGRAQYEATCSGCHDVGEAPVLVGDAFMRRWFGDNLQTVLTKMRTMPADAPGSLADTSYVDIMSFLLESSDFPAGSEELRANPEELARIEVVDREGTGRAVPNFSLVQVVGCVTQAADKAWMLARSSEPVRARESGDSAPADLKAAGATALGTHSFRLLDYPMFGREPFSGHKVQVKGFLIRQPNDDRLNVTSVQSLDQKCAP
jgi:cytochrome c5